MAAGYVLGGVGGHCSTCGEIVRHRTSDPPIGHCARGFGIDRRQLRQRGCVRDGHCMGTVHVAISIGCQIRRRARNPPIGQCTTGERIDRRQLRQRGSICNGYVTFIGHVTTGIGCKFCRRTLDLPISQRTGRFSIKCR
ncbi:MAG: hypothetical protein A4E66_01093 [Syntrophus sp. PtaB.Bin001]|nr:MAG: hypothetical protein A4E66_01093 [Syntrophus sp. PtaB.Bin001]